MDWKAWMNQIKTNWIASSAVMILLGLFLLFFPGAAVVNLGYLIGGVAIALGVISIVTYFRQHHADPFLFQFDLILGLMILGLGLFAVINPQTMLSLIPIVCGVLLIGCGVGNILRAVDARQAGHPLWGVMLGLAILTVVVGWMILCNPIQANELAASLIGAGLIYEGVADIVIVYLFGKRR